MTPLFLLVLPFSIVSALALDGSAGLINGQFSWKASAPLIGPNLGKEASEAEVSLKDPTVVFADGRWHIFATVRLLSGKVDIAYLNFSDWSHAKVASRHLLSLHDQYYCAPQVFYFSPHQKWYLIYQLADKTRTPAFGPYFSTTSTLTDPRSWSKPQPMVTNAPAKPKWLDFWVICDEQKAHLFYTSLDGQMWRRETRKADFPCGWSESYLAIRGDIFEASHTYKLKGRQQYLTLVEAQGGGRRYYKAYVAGRLEGPWQELAATLAKPFAGYSNVKQAPEWTTSISHGELLRTGVDERLEVDPAHLRFLFQGVTDKQYHAQGYRGIPWRLGLLE